MAYLFDKAASNLLENATVPISPVAGSLAIVFSATSSGGGTPTVGFSDDGASSWLNASNNVILSGFHFSIGYCLSVNPGVTTVTATYNGGAPGTTLLGVASYTGMVAPSLIGITAPLSQASPGTTPNAIFSNTQACGSTSALFVGCCVDLSTGNVGCVAGTGFTMRLPGGTGSGCIYIEDPNAEVTGSQTATLTANTHATDTYASFTIAFADVTGIITPTSGTAVLSGNTAGIIQGNIITPATAKIRDAVRSFFLPRYRGLVRG